MNLLSEAKRLAPQLAETAAVDRELRRLSDQTWKILLDGGFVRSLQPARWGGGGVSLIDFVDAMLELSRVSPAAGWVAGVIGVHPWQLALFDDAAQRELWSEDAATIHSSSYNPTGKAEKVAGGYKVSGRWSFSSGCDHCRGVTLGAICRSREVAGKPVRDFRSFLLRRDQYQIDDNWHVAGLQGTGSKDIVVAEAFVPEYRSQSHFDYATNLPLPGQKLNDGPLYRLPWSVVFHHGAGLSDARLSARLCGLVDSAHPRSHSELRWTRGRRRIDAETSGGGDLVPGYVHHADAGRRDRVEPDG
jgi:3-hydroxy-9,10-secoandrosta-1,3,5(10)-triene-9,17-dione monooxygenase